MKSRLVVTIVSTTALLIGGALFFFVFRGQHLDVSAQNAADAAVQKIPLDNLEVFPSNSSEFTPEQQERYRQKFVEQLTVHLGKPVGWKIALGEATPTTPSLGYTKPALGQFLEQMIIYSPEAHIDSNFAMLPLYEVDFFVRVSNEAINTATTPEQFLENIDTIYPAFELPAGFVSSLDKLHGPEKGGQSLLPLINGAARLAVLGNPIEIPGSQSLAQWHKLLSTLSGEEIVTTDSDTIKRTFTVVNVLEPGLLVIKELIKHGHRAKKGDLISLGNLTGVHQFTHKEQKIVARFDSLIKAGLPGVVTLTIK